MTSTDLHQVVFQWPHTEPTTVIITGTFDEWAASIHLTKIPTGFEGIIQIPWEQKIKYKFIVDGEWLVQGNQPTEVDPGGFVNNIYTAPVKPVIAPPFEATSLPAEADKPIAVEVNNPRTNGDSVVNEVAEKPKHIPQTLPKYTQSLTGTTNGGIVGAKLKTSDTSGFPQLHSDLANTIAARDGTSSAYVASGLGAAIHSAVGIDPVNIPKIAIPTPKYDDNLNLPSGMDTMSPTIMEECASELPSSPIAPLVPIMIVPVNVAENNTVTSSSPPDSMHILPRPMNTNGVSDAVTVESALTKAETIHVKSEAPADKFPEPTLVQSNEAIVPRPTPVGEVKSEEDLSPDSKERSCDKKPVEDAVETVVEPTSVVFENPPVNRAVTESVVERTPIPVIQHVDVAELPLTEDYLVVDQPSVDATTTTPGTAANVVNPIVVTEREVGESTLIPQTTQGSVSATNSLVTPRKSSPSSLIGGQEFPSFQANPLFQSADNSPSSSKFNSVRKKRISIFGKIKNIFHHDKEKERK